MALDREALLNRVIAGGRPLAEHADQRRLRQELVARPAGQRHRRRRQELQVRRRRGEERCSRPAGVPTSFDVPMHFSSTVYTTVVPYYDIVRQALPAMLAGGRRHREGSRRRSTASTSPRRSRGEFDGFAFSLESVFSDIARVLAEHVLPARRRRRAQPLERQRRELRRQHQDDARGAGPRRDPQAELRAAEVHVARRCTTCRS